MLQSLTGRFRVLARWWRVATGQCSRQDELIDGIVAQLRTRLHEVLSNPHQGGKKVIINISPDRNTAWIELPPEVLEVKTHR
jgi:hypothetical protein